MKIKEVNKAHRLPLHGSLRYRRQLLAESVNGLTEDQAKVANAITAVKSNLFKTLIPDLNHKNQLIALVNKLGPPTT